MNEAAPAAPWFLVLRIPSMYRTQGRFTPKAVQASIAMGFPPTCSSYMPAFQQIAYNKEKSL